ncbi:dTDP-4-dehydrorhamnose reductase [Treponema sp.]|uniref:dTDP-4-dehydrorhamnose reductase n=1 Tax=Treponema sp. TaxID=166 RepID=UPI00298E2BF9|nr:dTDP-4-dehydrorhamnose reductase [Treponema sp.]MCQ2241387.1 dTDP-4-dehydrorhamnose reductase [Treponema sp.]
MVWLIGCNGMLGTEVARQLKENKIDYVGTDREVDFTDESAVETFGAGKDIGFIINCAAYTAVDKAESDVDLCRKLNVQGPEVIAKYAEKIGATILHISTDYVFDGTGDTPRTEDMPIAPIGVYGVTKAEGEKAISDNASKYYILRTAWLYGWAGKNFVYTMIRAMNTHDAVKVVNDQKGTPTFAGDLAKVIIQIYSRVESNNPIEYGIYHCTDLGEITWWDFTNEIKKQAIEAGYLTNKDCVVNPCTTDEYPTPAKRPACSVLCKDKIQKTLGMQLPDWKESLHLFLSNSMFDKNRLV